MDQQLAFVLKAGQFAAWHHRHQRRKDADQLPYINHLIEVAHLLAESDAAPTVVAAGFLHDTIEDVGVTYESIVKEFGLDVADLVKAVTDDKSLPKGRRKNLQVEHMAHASAAVGALKLADKISNLRAIVTAPPKDWPQERIEQYIAWADRVVSQISTKPPLLWSHYESIRKELLQKFPGALTADPVYPEE